MNKSEVSWWERTVPDGTAWHYVQLAAGVGTPLAGIARCACGRYRAVELTVSPLTAPQRLHRAPADRACLDAMMRSASRRRGGLP